MDIVVLSLIAGAVVAVGLWLATRDSPPPEPPTPPTKGS